MTTTLQTPLHPWHSSNNGRMVDFAGWSMPVQYGSIVEEHHAVRKAIGLFDISHMGRLNFGGEDAAQFLDHVATRRIAGMKPGQIRYGLVCNESGGILDDVLVYHLTDGQEEGEKDSGSEGTGKHPTHQMVVNASNREKIIAWFNQLLDSGKPFSRETVWFDDVTLATAMIAVQGPLAVETMQPLLDVDLQGMKYYTGSSALFSGSASGANTPCFVSRTGYTGEDGCELTVGAQYAVPIWEAILEAGKSHGAMAAGLGARDTLRLEAAMPLYGHELSEEINPVQAGLGFAINLKDREFIGKSAILEAKRSGDLPVRVGLQLTGRRAAREGCNVLLGDEIIGTITSGTYSPTLEYPIAMAYINPSANTPEAELQIDIRGKLTPAKLVPLPFYSRAK